MNDAIFIAEKLGDGVELMDLNGKGYYTKCPCHEDSQPRMQIWDGPEGKLRYKCIAGCSRVDITKALKALRLIGSLSDDTSHNFNSQLSLECHQQIMIPFKDALSRAICTSTELLSMQLESPIAYIPPLIFGGNLCLIHAKPGEGKSWLGLSISVGLTREHYQDVRIGKLRIINPCSVLHVDGEFIMSGIQGRADKIEKYMGPESQMYKLRLLSGLKVQELSGKAINISHQDCRDYITDIILADPTCKLLVLDNLSSLSHGRNENSKSSIDAILGWLNYLKTKGVSTLIIHHSNKKGEDRGSSVLRYPLDTKLRLEKSQDQRVDVVDFVAVFEKGRNLEYGLGESLSFKMIGDNETGLRFIDPHEESLDDDTDDKIADNTDIEDIDDFLNHVSIKDIS